MKRLLVFLLILTACSADAEMDAHMAESNGASIAYPAEWELAPESLTPVLGFPMLFAISTFDAPVGGEICAQVAANALDAIVPEDVLLTIHELPFGYAFGPRPSNFKATAEFTEGGDMLECMQTDSSRIRGGQFRFFESDRTFDVILAMGPDTPQEVQDQAWAMLESFSAEPLDQ